MPSHNETHSGTWGWLGVAAGVLAFDVLSEESMSHAFSRYPKPLAIGGLVLVAIHLMDLIPEQVDPIDTIQRYTGARRYTSQCIAERNLNDRTN